MDGGARWAAVHGVARSRTPLSDFPFTFHFHALEKEMATHSSVLPWRIPGTVEPVGLAVYVVAQSRTWLKWLTLPYLMLSSFSQLCLNYFLQLEGTTVCPPTKESKDIFNEFWVYPLYFMYLSHQLNHRAWIWHILSAYWIINKEM